MPTSPGPASADAHRPSSETEAQHLKAVQRVVATLREQSDETLSLQQLAEVAIMSPSHLDRVFHRMVGVSPRRYLSAVRLSTAKRLLLNTSLSVLDVCFEVGYRSLGSFTSLFSQRVGLPPSKFRQLVEKDSVRIWEQINSRWAPPRVGSRSHEPGIYGTVSAPEDLRDPIFVGLFGSASPEGPPMACTVLQGPGEFQIQPVAAAQEVYPFAVALSWGGGWESLLLHDSVVQAGSEVENGWKIPIAGMAGPVELRLAPPSGLHPPISVAIPALIQRWNHDP